MAIQDELREGIADLLYHCPYIRDAWSIRPSKLRLELAKQILKFLDGEGVMVKVSKILDPSESGHTQYERLIDE